MNEITNDTSWLVSVLHDEYGQILLDKVNSTREAILKFVEVLDIYNRIDIVAECLESEYECNIEYSVDDVTTAIMNIIEDSGYAMTIISDDNFRLKVSDEEPIGENDDICMYGWCYGNIFFAAKPLFD